MLPKIIENYVYRMTKVNRTLTPRELEVAEKLKKAWLKKKELESLSQEKLAGKLGMTQGAVNFYLNGKRPFGLEALMNFCSELDVNIVDIYPEIMTKHGTEETVQALEFLALFQKADEGVRKGVLTILRSSK